MVDLEVNIIEGTFKYGEKALKETADRSVFLPASDRTITLVYGWKIIDI